MSARWGRWLAGAVLVTAASCWTFSGVATAQETTTTTEPASTSTTTSTEAATTTTTTSSPPASTDPVTGSQVRELEQELVAGLAFLVFLVGVHVVGSWRRSG